MQATHRRPLPHGRLILGLGILLAVILGTGVAFAATRGGSNGTTTLRPSTAAVRSSAPAIPVPTTMPGQWPTNPAGKVSTTTPPTAAPATAAPAASAPATTTPAAASTATTAPATAPATSPTTAATTPAPGSPGGTPLTYVVKPGDNLSNIAAWFKLNGYQALYQANAAVIGADPNLIFAGQVITISNGQMSMG